MFELEQTPIVGKIISVRYMKFDFHKQFWVTVETVGGGVIRARLCPEDLSRLEFEGYDVSQWGIQRCKTIPLSQPIYASFVWNGITFILCEVLLNDPFAMPELEYETGEDQNSRRARLLLETCYRNVSREDANFWMDLHPELIVDILWMLGDDERRAEIDAMYRKPEHLRVPEPHNDFEREQWEAWDREYNQ